MKMCKRLSIHTLLVTILFSCSNLLSEELLTTENIQLTYGKSAKRWDKAIQQFEKLNAKNTYPKNSTLFIGSSSIRLWRDLPKTMIAYNPIQRGFGGSTWSDVAVHINRIITPHNYKAAVFFVGNDIAGKPNDKSPEEVLSLISYTRREIKRHNPQAKIFIISVTPTPARFRVYPVVKKAHKLQQQFCDNLEDMTFIDTEELYLDAKGKPRPELFVKDRLHMNEKGYAIWQKAITKVLKKHLSKEKK